MAKTERGPEDEGLTPEQRSEYENLFFKNGKVWNKIFTIYLRAVMVKNLIATERGRKILSNKEARDVFLDLESRTGLLEKSIIGNPLIHPMGKENTLKNSSVTAGKYASWDFDRTAKFKKKNPEQYAEGTLFAFFMPGITDFKSSTYTPIGYADYLSLDIIYFRKTNIKELEKIGYVREISNKEAFENAGILHQYEKGLTLMRAIDKKVFQITPKGNSLVYLTNPMGEKLPEKKRAGVLTPVLE